MFLLEFWQETLCFSGVAKVIWGNVLSCRKGVKPSFKLQVGTQDCSCVTAEESGLILGFGEISWFFSSCGRKLRVPLDLQRESGGVVIS